MNKIGAAAVIASAGTFACVLVAGTASADPSGTPTFRQYAGVGSDTTQDVMNALANAVTISGTKVLGSYNATGSAQITTKAAATGTVSANCTINRPNGSGQGKGALGTSMTAADGCVDFSRSSSGIDSSTPSGTTLIPFGIDAVSYAVTNVSAASRNYTQADLNAIYHCNSGIVGSSSTAVASYTTSTSGTTTTFTGETDKANNFVITPILPQAGSGTRKFFLGFVGLTEADITPASLGDGGSLSCLYNGYKNGQIVEEHTGTPLDDKSVVPFSIGQFESQSTQLIADRRGRGVLGTVDGKTPSLTNTAFTSALVREVYNIVPTAKLAGGSSPDTTLQSIFVGSGSLLCSQASIISAYGFGLDPNCGATTLAKP